MPSKPKPYKEVRKDLFKLADAGQLGSAEPKPRKVRDFRVPRRVWTPVARIRKMTDSNWSARCKTLDRIRDSLFREQEWLGDNAGAYEMMLPERRAVLVAWHIEAEVNNGGFDQFYLNSSGDCAGVAAASLVLIGAPKHADLVKRANAVFPKGPPADRDQRLKVMEKLGDKASSRWSELDGEYFDLELALDDLVFPFVQKHLDRFVKA